MQNPIFMIPPQTLIAVLDGNLAGKIWSDQMSAGRIFRNDRNRRVETFSAARKF